jgi:hypothetical protein
VIEALMMAVCDADVTLHLDGEQMYNPLNAASDAIAHQRHRC